MVVAFIGQRKIEDVLNLRECLMKTLMSEIENNNVDAFLFGSRSEFDDIK